jgi:hypothetical protein
MKAKVNLSAKIDGIQYNVSPGENVPPVLAEFYAANGATDGLIAAGAIEAERLTYSTDNATVKKGK